jgi:hypothetical protein
MHQNYAKESLHLRRVGNERHYEVESTRRENQETRSSKADSRDTNTEDQKGETSDIICPTPGRRWTNGRGNSYTCKATFFPFQGKGAPTVTITVIGAFDSLKTFVSHDYKVHVIWGPEKL